MNPELSNNQLRDVPEVPEGSVPQSPMLSQDTMKRNLDSMFGSVEGRMRNMNSMNFVQKNKRVAEKSDAIQGLFQALMQAGIEPSDVASVGRFLEDLKTKSPAMYELFVRVFDELLPSAQQDMNTNGESTEIPGTQGVPQGV